MLRLTALSALFVCLVSARQVNGGALINGDFETGDWTGWTLFTTPNGQFGGVYGAEVKPFDTDGDGTPTNSVVLLVGSRGGGHGGGGVYQNVFLYQGDLTVSADVYAGGSPNSEMGLLELLFDQVVVDSVHYRGGGGRDTLSATMLDVTPGMHEIRLQALRQYGTSTGGVPKQCFDNVVISGSAVPEPSSLLLLLAAAVGLLGYAWRRRRG